MEITVQKKFLRQSPSKIRPRLHLVRNKRADKAFEILRYSNDKASRALYFLLGSAISAAKEKEMEEERLIIKSVRCDQASRLKRYVFKAKGRTARITKRNSHLTLTLSDEIVKEYKTEKKDKSDKKQKQEVKNKGKR